MIFRRKTILSLLLLTIATTGFIHKNALAENTTKCKNWATVPLLEGDKSPYVFLPISIVHNGIFLWDTGTQNTVLDPVSAALFGIPYTSVTQMKATVNFGFGPTESSFSWPNNNSIFTYRVNYMFRENGIIGSDWLTQFVSHLNYANNTITLWQSDNWPACAAPFNDYDFLPFIHGYANGDTDTPTCYFENQNKGCSIPFIHLSIIEPGNVEFLFDSQIDTGRDASWNDLVSVNKSLLVDLKNQDLLETPYVEPSNIRLSYKLKPGIKLKFGKDKYELRTIEYRPPSAGAPYDQTQSIALVGMGLLKNYSSILLDPFRKEIRFKK